MELNSTLVGFCCKVRGRVIDAQSHLNTHRLVVHFEVFALFASFAGTIANLNAERQENPVASHAANPYYPLYLFTYSHRHRLKSDIRVPLKT
jgi:hypothetical protein